MNAAARLLVFNFQEVISMESECAELVRLVAVAHDTKRCPKCGRPLLIDVDEIGDATASCPGCHFVCGWSYAIF